MSSNRPIEIPRNLLESSSANAEISDGSGDFAPSGSDGSQEFVPSPFRSIDMLLLNPDPVPGGSGGAPGADANPSALLQIIEPPCGEENATSQDSGVGLTSPGGFPALGSFCRLADLDSEGGVGVDDGGDGIWPDHEHIFAELQAAVGDGAASSSTSPSRRNSPADSPSENFVSHLFEIGGGDGAAPHGGPPGPARTPVPPRPPPEVSAKTFDQFRSTAETLGIPIPPHMLQRYGAAVPAEDPAAISENNAIAEDSIAVVTGGRGGGGGGAAGTQSGDGVMSGDLTGGAKRGGDGSSAGAAPAASGGNKKRKRFNLEDNESKLEQLRVENDTLLRQLDRLRNRTQKFDEDRRVAEEEMKRMMSAGTKSDADIVPALGRYTELYSDYGQTRNRELAFHLEQLERLITPNSYTKMHLWTLGQGLEFFRRPDGSAIAGALMK